MRNNDTMQSLTINPSKTATLACTYEFFPRQTLSENTTSLFFFFFSKGPSHNRYLHSRFHCIPTATHV